MQASRFRPDKFARGDGAVAWGDRLRGCPEVPTPYAAHVGLGKRHVLSGHEDCKKPPMGAFQRLVRAQAPLKAVGEGFPPDGSITTISASRARIQSSWGTGGTLIPWKFQLGRRYSMIISNGPVHCADPAGVPHLFCCP
jgi:hypothetical protein